MIKTMSVSKSLLSQLLEGERVVSIKNVVTNGLPAETSGLHQLYRLAGAENSSEVGEFGPVLASKSLEDHSAAPELRRYEAVFGRDALRVALDLLEQYPKLARSTLVMLAELQGVSVNVDREEEPGRIIHEARDPETDPIARHLSDEFGWGWPYYGSIDSTVEFIRTMAAYCTKSSDGPKFLEQTYQGRDGHSHTMGEAMVAAVEWVTNRLDSNPEGLLEFKRMNPQGIENQVWKDSWDAYAHASGEIANHGRGIASIEVQRVAFDALLDAAGFYEKYFDKKEQAAALRQRSQNLQKTILDKFWSEDKGGFFVLGTDRDGGGNLRQLAVRTSNMGHVLGSPLLLGGSQPENVRRREALIRHLFSPDMLNVSGIRTLAKDEYRFRPGAYHNGSVWLWDTYFIARGLDLHGYHRLANELNNRLQDVVTATRQFPEFVRGGDESEPAVNTRVVEIWDEKYSRLNRLEQPPQEVQAWTVAAILSMPQITVKGGPKSPDFAKASFEDEILGSILAQKQ